MNRVNASPAGVTAAATTAQHHTRSTHTHRQTPVRVGGRTHPRSGAPAADPHHREGGCPQQRGSGPGTSDDYPLVDKGYARCPRGHAPDCADIQRGGRSAASGLPVASRISGAFPDGTRDGSTMKTPSIPGVPQNIWRELLIVRAASGFIGFRIAAVRRAEPLLGRAAAEVSPSLV